MGRIEVPFGSVRPGAKCRARLLPDQVGPGEAGREVRGVAGAALAVLLASGSACALQDEEPGARWPEPPAIRDTLRVLPSGNLPPGVIAQDANNNLDAAVHDGRLVLAFRTAPTHFASAETELHVISRAFSPDEPLSANDAPWDHEASFAMQTDLREPRLLSWDGQLFMFFAVLGDNPGDFEPQGARWTRRDGAGDWSDPLPLLPEIDDGDFLPWRARVLDGTPYLVGYTGGAAIYDEGGDDDSASEGEGPALRIHVFRGDGEGTAEDGGVPWEPAWAGESVVREGGGSETDFAILADGSLLAVSRNEEGDDLGWGSHLCTAPAAAPGQWTCAGDPRKYDSPLVFRRGARTWMLARRNVTETGHYDLFRRELGHDEQTRQYQLDYWEHGKRCALWELFPSGGGADGTEPHADFVLDLPSQGDTCFPAVVDLDAGDSGRRLAAFNYSSPVESGEDLSWLAGQLGPTRIYVTELFLP
jgi:hypothetical protein